MAEPATARALRLDGWGYAGETFPPSPALLAWLRQRLGPTEPSPTFDPAGFQAPPPADLPELGCALAAEPLERLRCARGRGFTDLVKLRSGTVAVLPDAVARPADDDQLGKLLATASEHGLRLIPRGGGTSVTGGVNALAGDSPLVTVDLSAFRGLAELDETSGLASFGAGSTGPEIEEALGARGFTLGHFPQSWELSTLGGWIATRSTGQESLAYGRIEQLVAGLDLVAPAGRLRLPSLPASAAGPDLRQLVLGSEGRFGVIARATVRVRAVPESTRVEAALLPEWDAGVEAVRGLVQCGVPLALLRLSDGPETEVSMAVGLGKSRLAPLAKGWLRLRGIGRGAALLLVGASGSWNVVDAALEEARTMLRPYGAAWLGARPGRRWLADRFRHPYLRDALLDRGVATDPLETAAPWSRLDAVYAAVGEALGDPGDAGVAPTTGVPVLCHLSHPYRDGASLYFTFFFRCPADPGAAVERWAGLKRRATAALCRAGGTVSHHHGVGSWHAPWYPAEAGETGLAALRRTAAELDPRGVLNPHVLLAPEDRLTE